MASSAMTLTLIQTASKWMHWTTFRRRASSQVIPIFNKSPPSSNSENNISAPGVTRTKQQIEASTAVGTTVPREYDIQLVSATTTTRMGRPKPTTSTNQNASTNSVSMTSSRSPSPELLNRIRTLMLSENRTLLLRREASESRFSQCRLEWDGLPGEGEQYS